MYNLKERIRIVEREEADSWDGAGNVTSVKTIQVLQVLVELVKEEEIQASNFPYKKEVIYFQWQDVPIVKEDD